MSMADGSMGSGSMGSGSMGVDDYIDRAPAKHRDALLAVRSTLMRIIPGVEETIEYQIPAFIYRGRALVGLSASERQCSLHLMSTSVAAALDGSLLTGRFAGARLHFSADDPLDEQTVRLVVDMRIAEIEGRRSGARPASAG